MGEQILYSVLLGTHVEMFIKNAGSSDNGRMLQTGLDGSKTISDVSPDGNSILYQHESETLRAMTYRREALLDWPRGTRRTAEVVAGRRLGGAAVE